LSPRTRHPFPSKDELVAFIGSRPGKIGTREIARAFGMRNADRATLKQVLRELADEGQIERRRRKTRSPRVAEGASLVPRNRGSHVWTVPSVLTPQTSKSDSAKCRSA